MPEKKGAGVTLQIGISLAFFETKKYLVTNFDMTMNFQNKRGDDSLIEYW